MNVATKQIIGAAFGSAGERCMAASVVAAQEEIADQLIERLVEEAKWYCNWRRLRRKRLLSRRYWLRALPPPISILEADPPVLLYFRLCWRALSVQPAELKAASTICCYVQVYIVLDRCFAASKTLSSVLHMRSCVTAYNSEGHSTS